MQIIQLLFIAILYSSFAFSQTTEAHYYKDADLRKEVPEEKASYSKMTTRFPDGTISLEVRRMATDEMMHKESSKNSEPVGIWIIDVDGDKKEFNYTFDLVYSDANCAQEITLEDYFTDDAGIIYKAPEIDSGAIWFYKYIGTHLYYPRFARDNGIEGNVFLTFTINTEGGVEDVKVKRGVAPCLDKEAMRVIRELIFTSPPMLKGEAISVCVTMPLVFRLE